MIASLIDTWGTECQHCDEFRTVGFLVEEEGGTEVLVVACTEHAGKFIGALIRDRPYVNVEE